ncbi:MAG: peptidase M48 [Chitinophagaceae bacterium]|nr:MAG: peptidase M48 [Chitinophagaceae bacterium]
MKRILLFGSLAAAVALANSCARNPVTGKKQVVFTSEAQEIQQGAEADPQIVAQFGLYPDSALQRYIRERGNAVAAVSHRPGLQWSYKILDSDVINAFATPGGYVYFTRGIMAHFNDEAQMEGVLGHETGHVTARHSVIQQRNQMLGQVGLIAGVIINPNLGQFADQVSQGLGLLLLKFGRDDERQADELGVEYSTKLGYNAHRMAEFFNTLKRQSQAAGGQTLPPFLSTHPDPGDRFVTVNQLATEWQQKTGNTANLKVNRDTYLRRLEGLVYGADPRQGFVENGAFYHPELRFQFPVPQGWQSQNSPTQFQMAPQDGKALMILTLAEGNNLQTAATAQLQKYGLTARSQRSGTVNGIPAYIVVADQQPQQQGAAPLRTLNYFLQYNNAIYHMIGVTSATDYPAYENQFASVMEGFRSLTEADKLNRKPERVHIRTVATGGTLRQVLTSYNVPERRLDELSILNGMQLTDNVAKGTLIKTVGP